VKNDEKGLLLLFQVFNVNFFSVLKTRYKKKIIIIIINLYFFKSFRLHLDFAF
jgi:hypothetical protein